jgi:catechol 2,3-dioxygenase
MKVERLGHAVLKVRDVGRAEDFSHGVLGFPIAARTQAPFAMTFFTLGNHHDFAVLGVGPDGPDAADDGPGLFHVAFNVGDSLDQLREVKKELEEAGVPIELVADHTVSQSVYVRDPDGNGVELYVDTSDVWKTDPQTVASMAPLEL